MVANARQEIFETGDVAMSSGCDERVEKTPVIGRTRGHPSDVRDVVPGSSHHLPRIGLFEPKEIRDITVWIVERFPKDVRGSFGGRQLFQQQENATRQCLTSFRFQPRVGAGVDWFGQPGSDVVLSARARGLQDVDRESRGRGNEERQRIADRAPIRGLPPNPDVLDDVLGLRRAAQHAIRNAKQPGPGA
jgi:hypothetical protein